MTPAEIIDRILVSRGIDLNARDLLLNPDFERDIHDALAMKGMRVAVERIIASINKKEQITIFGDYDADGVPATALMVRGFRGLGVEVQPLIPTRQSGYGLTHEMVGEIKRMGTNLLITVDNGTVSKEEIASLAESGIDTIVCDHHEPQVGHMADKAVAILNPKQEDCEYPCKELCGCALAWKLLGCLYMALGKPIDALKWELDLVALSTIADMVPLVGENRVLATYGMKVMRKSRNLGLQMLASVAGINLPECSPGNVSFQFAPRINAPSRMHNEVVNGENAALRLLTTQDNHEALELAHYLNVQNGERQQLLDDHLGEASSQAEDQINNLCLVLFHEDWSTGVIGLVAGRMLERYRRPVIVLAPEGKEIKGSVRSVEGVTAVDMLQAGVEYLEKFGGHSKAAGLTMKEGVVVGRFRDAVNEWMKGEGFDLGQLRVASLRKPDLDLQLPDVTVGLAEAVGELEPFGIGWPSPLFSTQCNLSSLKREGQEGKHLSCFLSDGHSRVKAIAFQQGGREFREDIKYEVVYTIEVDTWNDQRKVSAHIQRIEELS